MVKVSIVIPIYNVEKYINRCIESIINQNYVNYEIILVDDGSTDRSPVICDQLAEKHQNIHVMHKENSGPSDARNYGLEHAKGEWIVFVDSDDYVSNDFFDKINKLLLEENDLLVFGYSVIDENRQLMYQSAYDVSVNKFDNSNQQFDFVVSKLLTHKVGWEVWGKVFSRRIIEQYGIRFPKGVMIAEDQIFCVCYCMHINSVNINNDRLYYHSIRSNSIMTDYGIRNNIPVIAELSAYGFDHCLLHKEECSAFVDNYPIINYQLLNVEFSRLESIYGYTRKDFRSFLIKTENCDFLLGQFRDLLKIKNKLSTYYDQKQSKRIASDVKYYIDGKYLNSRIRNRLIKTFSTIR